MKYFSLLPTTTVTDGNNNSVILKNLLVRAQLIPKLSKNPLIFYEYSIQEDDTPEIIANKYYGDPYRYWIVLYGNPSIVDPQMDWPIEQNSLISFIDKKYQATEYANNSTTGAGKTWADTNIHSYYKIETQTNNFNQKNLLLRLKSMDKT